MIADYPVAFRLEFRPGDYLHYTLEEFVMEKHRQGATIWGLYEKPQPGCASEPAVYKGRFWIEPRYSSAFDLTVMQALYLGQTLHVPEIGVSF